MQNPAASRVIVAPLVLGEWRSRVRRARRGISTGKLRIGFGTWHPSPARSIRPGRSG